ncbi:MAG: DUF4785 family protein [Acidobacteriota bacterium]|nr:DUF4785 family protein [Acidobacteriota bacterium]
MKLKQGSLQLVFAAGLVLALTLSAGAQPAGQSGIAPAPVDRLLTSPGDVVSGSLVAPPESVAGPAIARDPVAFSWPLPADQALTEPTPFVAQSREYWRVTDAQGLAAGVELPIASAGALIRLNPAADAAWSEQVAIDPSQLVISRGGESFTQGEAMELLVSAEQMTAADAPFPAGTTAFRLSKDLGAGTITLQAPGLTGAKGIYVVHVLEPASSVVASVSADRVNYFHGDSLAVTLRLDGASAESVRGEVISPAGRTFPLSFAAGPAGHRAQLALDALEAPAEGLWQAEVWTVGRAGDLAVERAARTAFQVTVPTARLSGAVEIGGKSGEGFRNLTAKVGVETVAAGRYEVRGVLYGTDAAGQLRPMGTAHSADWLEAGEGTLKLRFHRRVFAESDFGAPFEVRDLQLLDQGRMGLLEERQRAFVVSR